MNTTQKITIIVFFPCLCTLFLIWAVVFPGGEVSIARYHAVQLSHFIEMNQFFSHYQWLWANLDHLGDALVLYPLLSVLLLKKPQTWAALLGAAPFAMLLSTSGKTFFSIPRPAAVISHDLFTIIGNPLTGHNSLPSGHTITIFTATTVLLCMIFISTRPHKWLWGVFGCSIASAVALARVAVGAHWPLDLIAGAGCGYIAGLCGVYLTYKYSTWWQWMCNPQYYMIFSVFFLIWAITLVFYLFAGAEIIYLIAAFSAMTVSSLLFNNYLKYRNNTPN